MTWHRRPLAAARGWPIDWFDLVRAGLALAALWALAVYLPRLRPDPTLAGRAAVIDGDSLYLQGRELRLAGIDAPELHQSCERGGRPYECGRVARDVLVAKLAAGGLVCRLSGTDRYGRALAFCALGTRDLNAALVREGAALAYGRYDAEEAAARAERAGVWAGHFERPADWRRRHPRPEAP